MDPSLHLSFHPHIPFLPSLNIPSLTTTTLCFLPTLTFPTETARAHATGALVRPPQTTIAAASLTTTQIFTPPLAPASPHTNPTTNHTAASLGYDVPSTTNHTDAPPGHRCPLHHSLWTASISRPTDDIMTPTNDTQEDSDFRSTP